MHKPTASFTAVILAADRRQRDPVAEASGAPCKSLTPIGGRPMLIRVLDALGAAQQVNRRIVCGPDRPVIDQHDGLRKKISTGKIEWVQHLATPSTSTYHVLQSIAPDIPVLVTTADHALLSAPIVDYFCTAAIKTGADIIAGLALYESVVDAYPGMRRTAITLSDARYCSCNLFAFLTPRSRKVAAHWRRVESQRKKPWRIVSLLGWIAVMRYVAGRLSLAEAQQRLSKRLGVHAAAVVLPFAEAAVDVDTVHDWKLVENIVTRRSP